MSREDEVLEVPSKELTNELKFKKGLGDEIIAAAMIVSELRKINKTLISIDATLEQVLHGMGL